MNIQHKTTTRKFPLNVLKSSHHCCCQYRFCLQMCNLCAQNATQFRFFFVTTELSLIKIPIISQIQPFFFSLLVIAWLILLLQNGISFLFACKVVYDSFIHSLQNSTLTVTVEKRAMNARHLFECENSLTFFLA